MCGGGKVRVAVERCIYAEDVEACGDGGYKAIGWGTGGSVGVWLWVGERRAPSGMVDLTVVPMQKWAMKVLHSG